MNSSWGYFNARLQMSTQRRSGFSKDRPGGPGPFEAMEVKIPEPWNRRCRELSKSVETSSSAATPPLMATAEASGCWQPYTSPCEELRQKAGEGQLQA